MKFTSALFASSLYFASAEQGRQLAKCERVDLDFSSYGNGDLFPTSSMGGVAISVRPRSKNKCIDQTAQIIDTSSPLQGCGAGQGDEDLQCDNCGKALIIGTRKNEDNSCEANDCRVGGTIYFNFDTPSQVLFLDMVDIDTKMYWNVTYGDNTSETAEISPGLQQDQDGGVMRAKINRNNVKQLSVHLKHSGAISKLAFRTCSGDGMTHGDPHFRAWGGKKFDYHGQCDLVLAKAPLAAKKGLDVHIRTKHIESYSYIERVAMKLGNDVVEIGHKDAIVNQEAVTDLTEMNISGNRFTRTETTTDNGRPLTIYRLYLSDTEWAEVKVFKLFLSVRFIGNSAENFMHASGILGDYYTGRTVARDGVTVMENADEFGLEWQVNDEDGQLFMNAPEQQFPTQCLAPPAMDDRKLNHGITQEQAEEACAGSGDFDSCVFDIMATGDLDMAGAF